MIHERLNGTPMIFFNSDLCGRSLAELQTVSSPQQSCQSRLSGYDNIADVCSVVVRANEE